MRISDWSSDVCSSDLKVLVHLSSIKRSPGRHLSPVIPGALLIPERGVRASPRPLQRTGAFAVLAPLLWEELNSSRPPYYSSYIGAGLGTWRTEGEPSRNRLPQRNQDGVCNTPHRLLQTQT